MAAGRLGGAAAADPVAALVAALSVNAPGTDAWLRLYGTNPERMIVGAITRNRNGAATSASVVWPDGTAGAYVATTLSTDVPGAVDAFTVTWVGSTARTVTQPAMTRDPITGVETNRPEMTVS